MLPTEPRVLTAARVVTGDEVLEPGWVEVSGEVITGVGAGRPPRRADEAYHGMTLVPGFVDMHVHGGGGFSVVGADFETVEAFVWVHRFHGTTSTVASLVSAPYDELERDIRTLAALTTDGLLAGVHLEGPWIAPSRKGAHDPAALRDPDRDAVARLLDAGGGAVRMVTLAPELPHGLDAVRAVVEAGAVAAVGHTDATYDVARAAIDAGATVATHLFNAMAPLGHRDPGPVVALLEDHRVTVELVCDGVHLHPATVRLAHAAAGTDRVALVTDAMAAAAGQDGDYRLGSLRVRVQEGVARLAEGGAIAGSTLTMDRAFRFAVQEAGFSLLEAVRASATTPARVLGLDRVGELRPGWWANVVVLDPDLQIRGTMLRGAWLAMAA